MPAELLLDERHVLSEAAFVELVVVASTRARARLSTSIDIDLR